MVMVMARNRNLEWALFYIRECGVPLFPIYGTVGSACACADLSCRNPGKHPHTAHGLKDASSDEERIREWWQQWPNANLGMPTGDASLLWVLDLDLPDGERSLAKLIDEHEPLPDTAVSITGSGGRQFFYAYPQAPLYNTTSRIAKNLDTRGEGGYVVLPPSRHITGRNYSWVKDHSLKQLGFLDAPEWLLHCALEASKKAETTTNGAAPEGAVHEGARNDHIYRKARSLRAKRFKEPVVLQAMLAENQSNCSPTLEPDEVRDIVANAFRQPHRVDFEVAAKKEERQIVQAGDPMFIARAWARKFIEKPIGRTLHRWDQRFWHWNGAHYEGLLDEDMHAPLWTFLRDQAIVLTGKQERTQPCAALVKDVFTALKATLNIPLPRLKPPGWVGQAPLAIPDAELLPVQNGLLHLPTGQLFEPTPQFFCLSSIQAPFDPRASTNEWDAFLNSIFPDDDDQIKALQEVMGYLITTEMEQQKIFMIIGPPRSGKGTIGNVLQMLLGDSGVARLSAGKFAETFGLAGLIGRQLAILSDTRIGGENSSELIERLLTISGQDSMDVARKFREDWQGKLNTRFLFLTNELPRFWDASGALSSRFLVLETRVSFLGREDHELLAKLRQELPGILNWAIVGWRRLVERGYFVQPKSVNLTIEQLASLTSPIKEFIDDHYKLAPAAELYLTDIYSNYKRWSRSQGQAKYLPENLFARDLRAAVPSLVIKRETINKVKKRIVIGLETEYWEPDSNSSENEPRGYSN